MGVLQYIQKYRDVRVNERAVRSTAGILFALGFSTFWYVILTKDFSPLYFVVPAFWLEFVLKVSGKSAYSPIDILGRWLVNGQEPDLVSLSPKLFAWSMGLGMSTLMCVLVLNGVTGWPPFLVCGSCLLFMWLEATCGFCIGCAIYRWARFEADHQQVQCAGNYCDLEGQATGASES